MVEVKPSAGGRLRASGSVNPPTLLSYGVQGPQLFWGVPWGTHGVVFASHTRPQPSDPLGRPRGKRRKRFHMQPTRAGCQPVNSGMDNCAVCKGGSEMRATSPAALGVRFI